MVPDAKRLQGGMVQGANHGGQQHSEGEASRQQAVSPPASGGAETGAKPASIVLEMGATAVAAEGHTMHFQKVTLVWRDLR